MSRYPAMDAFKAGDVFIWAETGSTMPVFLYVVLENDPDAEKITTVSYSIYGRGWWVKTVNKYTDWIFLGAEYLGYCCPTEEDMEVFVEEASSVLKKVACW